jgi:hypothetical protein
MKIKTKGKCAKCNELFVAAKAGEHLPTCALGSDMQPQANVEGYLIRISWTEQPDMYWMFATIPKSAPLSFLDSFLRDVWLECCGHLSEFTIGSRVYIPVTVEKWTDVDAKCGSFALCKIRPTIGYRG